MTHLDYIKRRNTFVKIRNLLLAGCVLWTAYSIYSWATRDAPVAKPDTTCNEDKDTGNWVYDAGKKVGDEISEFAQGVGTSITDKVKDGTNSYVEPWQQLGREMTSYAADLKKKYIEPIVK